MDELTNFRSTLIQLKNFIASPIVTDRDRAGVIQAFEFTFEQAWKAIQKASGRSGGIVGNPRQAFSLAIQSGWIDQASEMRWLRLLEDRNLTSHTYKAELAEQVLGRIQLQYIKMFEGLLEKLENDLTRGSGKQK